MRWPNHTMEIRRACWQRTIPLLTRRFVVLFLFPTAVDATPRRDSVDWTSRQWPFLVGPDGLERGVGITQCPNSHLQEDLRSPQLGLGAVDDSSIIHHSGMQPC